MCGNFLKVTNPIPLGIHFPQHILGANMTFFRRFSIPQCGSFMVGNNTIISIIVSFSRFEGGFNEELFL